MVRTDKKASLEYFKYKVDRKEAKQLKKESKAQTKKSRLHAKATEALLRGKPNKAAKLKAKAHKKQLKIEEGRAKVELLREAYGLELDDRETSTHSSRRSLPEQDVNRPMDVNDSQSLPQGPVIPTPPPGPVIPTPPQGPVIPTPPPGPVIPTPLQGPVIPTPPPGPVIPTPPPGPVIPTPPQETSIGMEVSP